MSLNGNTDKAVSLLREGASLLAGDRESDDTAVTPQNVTIDAKCNINAKCNNF